MTFEEALERLEYEYQHPEPVVELENDLDDFDVGFNQRSQRRRVSTLHDDLMYGYIPKASPEEQPVMVKKYIGVVLKEDNEFRNGYLGYIFTESCWWLTKTSIALNEAILESKTVYARSFATRHNVYHLLVDDLYQLSIGVNDLHFRNRPELQNATIQSLLPPLESLSSSCLLSLKKRGVITRRQFNKAMRNRQ